MQRRLIAVALVVAASAAVFANLAWARSGGAQADFNRACDATLGSLRAVVDDVATRQVRTIAVRLQLPRPGVVIGAIAFNPTGSELAVARDPPIAGQGSRLVARGAAALCVRAEATRSRLCASAWSPARSR